MINYNNSRAGAQYRLYFHSWPRTTTACDQFCPLSLVQYCLLQVGALQLLLSRSLQLLIVECNHTNRL